MDQLPPPTVPPLPGPLPTPLPPPVPSTGRRAPRWLHPAVAVVTVVSSIVVSAVVVVRATAVPPVSLSKAEQYLPADGSFDAYDFHTASGDTVLLSENQRVTGFGGLSSLPQFQGAFVLDALDGVTGPLESTRLWRSVSRQIADIGVTSQVVTLAVVADDGVRTVLTYGGSFPAVYDPPMMALPNDLRVGMTWADSGTAYPGGVLTYASEGGITAIDPDGCVHVSLSMVLTTQDGVEMQRSSADERWCPGRGMVDGSTDVTFGDALQRFEYERIDGGSAAVSAALERFDIPSLSDAPTGGDVADWASVPTPLVHREQFFGQQPLMGVMGVRPAVTADDLLLVALASAGDVVAFRLEDPLADSTDNGPSLVEQWRAHAGGEVMSVDVFDDMVVVTTSLRTVVGYDLDGVRRWELRTGDLVLGAPSAVGDMVVVHGLDGVVHAVDRHTGARAWSASTVADSDVGPVALADRVVVADRAGSLVGLDSTTGVQRWSVDGQRVVSMAAAGGVVVTLDDRYEARAYGPDGRLRWSTTVAGWPRSVLAVGEGIAVVGDDTAVLLDPTDGTTMWSSTEAVDAAALADRLVVHNGSEVCVVESSGELVGCVTVPVTDYGDTVYVAPGPAGVWLVESTLATTRVGVPRRGGAP